MDLSMLREICTRYKGCTSEYYVGTIPERKVNNTRESLKIPHEEEIIALTDLTIFGSATDAMVITERALYWKGTGDASPSSLSWDQLRQRTLSEKKVLLTKFIEFGDGLQMCLTGSPTFCETNNHVVLELLNAIRVKTEGEMPDQKTSVGTVGSVTGLFECEFCENLIKPEVTYCKHCGIKLRG